jgi:hypothetical protein
MSDWIAESDWSKVKHNDFVKFERGKESLIVMATSHHEEPYIDYRGGTCFQTAGWSLFVEEPPAVVLPIEPGHYLDKDGTAWRITARFPFRVDLHARHAPFTRLEPVSETAKKVLDRVLAVTEAVAGCPTVSPNMHRVVDEVVKRLRAEFGVEVDA